MSENKNINNNQTKPQTPAIPEMPTKYTVDYILTMLEKISNDQTHITSALEKLSKLKSKGPFSADPVDAIAHIVDAREDTNRKLISFYEKMYNDLTSNQRTLKEMAIKALEKVADDQEKIAAISEVLDTIRHLS